MNVNYLSFCLCILCGKTKKQSKKTSKKAEENNSKVVIHISKYLFTLPPAFSTLNNASTNSLVRWLIMYSTVISESLIPLRWMKRMPHQYDWCKICVVSENVIFADLCCHSRQSEMKAWMQKSGFFSKLRNALSLWIIIINRSNMKYFIY